MPDLIPGAMSPPLDDGLPSSPQRPDAYDARRSAEALRELERQHEHDPERPRSVWERRFDEWSGEWIDVEVGTLPPRAEAHPRAPAPSGGEGLEEEEQEHEAEEGAWLGLA